MNILILGSGGREHALAWKISQSKLCEQLYIAPGNAGTVDWGKNVALGITDFDGIKTFILNNNIDLLMVGPEEPLVLGIRDFLEADDSMKNLKIIGPGKLGAQLEGSKDFSKAFMQKFNIPTAAYRTFTKNNFDEGVQYLQQHSLPVVLKADGLAAGKGVVICQSKEEAVAEFTEMIQKQKFGEASARVVIEEFLTGIEMSVFVLTDGKNFVLLPEAKDYKKIGEGEQGLNTGGMGAVSPVPFYNRSLQEKVIEEIIRPTVNGLAAENIPYTGIIFIGLIVDNGAAKVIEYNCRLGDPETEVILTRLENDLVELLDATASQRLDIIKIKTSSNYAAGIVAVSGGYPGEYKKDIPINITIAKDKSTILFHSGTKKIEEQLLTNGGRLFVAVSEGKTLKEAVAKSISTLADVEYEGKYFRRDIGFEFE